MNKLDITAKIADGCAVKFSLTVEVVLTAEPVALDGIREVVLTDGTEYALDLGEYSALTALGATLGDENATYSNGKLTLTDAYKQNTQKHGNTVLTATFEKGGKYYNVTANVLVVTKEISTFDELRTALAFNNENNNVKFGYYRLKSNLEGYGWYQSKNNVSDGIWKNPNGELGFRGTFDGNGYSIRETFTVTGLFGFVGKGAVIKNTTFNMNLYRRTQDDPSFMLFGYSMIGATIDNVKVNLTKQTDDGITEIKDNFISGLLTGIFSHGNTFNKLVVDAQKTDIDTLFGSCAYYGYPAGATNTFVDCTVKAKSLLGLACINNTTKEVMPYAPYTGAGKLTVTITG